MSTLLLTVLMDIIAHLKQNTHMIILVQLENFQIRLQIPSQATEEVVLQDMDAQLELILSPIHLLSVLLLIIVQLEVLPQLQTNVQRAPILQTQVLLLALNAQNAQLVLIVPSDQSLQLDYALLDIGAQKDLQQLLKMHVQKEHIQLELA